ncbi:MAG: hypothetical protein WCR51_02010 [Planctomycetia bacterium]
MNHVWLLSVWLLLAASGCGFSTPTLQLAKPLSPEEEKATIDAFQKAWAQGDGAARDTPVAPTHTAP